MSLSNLDISDRENPGPPDLLVAVESIIVKHTPDVGGTGWDHEEWVCRTCDARLTPEEARTHTAQKLWERGYLTIP